MKQKLKLDKIKVKSFITETEGSEKVLGGDPRLHNLMLHNHANIGHYGFALTSFMQTRQREIGPVRG